MNTDIFYEELKGRFLPSGKVGAAYSTDSVKSSQWLDYIWVTDNNYSEIRTQISNLQTIPEIRFDVYGNLSMSYALGTPTSVIMAAASKQYASNPHALEVIKLNTDLILDAFNTANVYDKASLLYTQFISTGMSDDTLISKAWDVLKGFAPYGMRCKALFSAVERYTK